MDSTMTNVVLQQSVITGKQLVQILVIAFATLAVIWGMTFYVLRSNKDALKSLIGNGNLLKVLTVILLVFAVALLAILKELRGNAVATIYSGIAGYVLGSMRYQRKDNQSDSGTT